MILSNALKCEKAVTKLIHWTSLIAHAHELFKLTQLKTGLGGWSEHVNICREELLENEPDLAGVDVGAPPVVEVVLQISIPNAKLEMVQELAIFHEV